MGYKSKMEKVDTVLIVEDDADLRNSLAELLALRGFKVVTVEDGREALDTLASGLSPCLIILDLMLPIVNGWEFRSQQLADPRFSGIPTIILSGVNDLEAESQRLQAIAFVPKPLDIDFLFKTVEQYC
jgi:DNA-binding response OmpR family regulator